MDILLILGSAGVIVFILILIMKARQGKKRMGYKDRAVFEAEFDPLEKNKNQSKNKTEIVADSETDLIIEEEQPITSPTSEPNKIETKLPEPNPAFVKGKLKYKNNHWKEAKEDFLAALNETPDDAQTRFILARTHIKLKEYNEAIVQYTEAIRLQLEEIDAFFERGHAHFILKNYKNALQDFDTYLIVKPESTEALFYRGQAKSLLSDYTGAIDDFSKIINLKPHHSDAYFERGLTKNKMGDKDGCCSDLKKAFDKGHLEAYYHIKNICGEEIKLRRND